MFSLSLCTEKPASTQFKIKIWHFKLAGGRFVNESGRMGLDSWTAGQTPASGKPASAHDKLLWGVNASSALIRKHNKCGSWMNHRENKRGIQFSLKCNYSARHCACFNIDLTVWWKPVRRICFKRHVDAGSTVRAGLFWRVKSEQRYSKKKILKKGSTKSFGGTKKQKLLLACRFYQYYALSWRPASERARFYASLSQRQGAAPSRLWEKGRLKYIRPPCDKRSPVFSR